MSDYTVLTQNDNGEKKYLVRKAGYTGGGSSSGGTTIDAYTKTETDTLLSGKQDKLIAGENITIEGNVISSTGASVDLSNYATKQFAKDASFPSVRFDELTLGASLSEYVAPANGYFVVQKVAGMDKAWFNFEVLLENKTVIFLSSYMSPAKAEWVSVSVPVLKGQLVRVSYDMPGETKYFRFIYAQGENEDV